MKTKLENVRACLRVVEIVQNKGLVTDSLAKDRFLL